MDARTLYEMLELPASVKETLELLEQKGISPMPEELKEKILDPARWDAGIRELQLFLGDDPDGMKMLWELLQIAGSFSYEQYKEKGIPLELFAPTMKFCTRFLGEHLRTYGTYQFVWGWWFPRQLSLREFRVGALEYEFAGEENRRIYLHIPSDADLRPESVSRSIKDFLAFRKDKFPQWADALMACDSWMLSPALKELLDADSNILAFQNRFVLDETDPDAMWFMDWVYPGCKTVDETLPEGTSLQRRMKAHLLQGKKVGVARGHLILGEEKI